MSRKDFIYQQDIHIEHILLDYDNPRIRAGKNQEECIARILRKEDQMIALIKNIAEEGLTTMPILVYPTEDGRWIVKDGNRRITALKLLNNPELCPKEYLKNQIKATQNKFLTNIPKTVDCLSSRNLEAIFKEVIARHSGAMGGIGQLDWSTYLRTIYLINNGHAAENKRAGQYLFWAEDHGIYVDETFPITNINRFINTTNLELLGFKIVNDKLVAVLAEDKIIKMANKIITDFGPGGNKQVQDVFTPEQAKGYLNEVMEHAGIQFKITPTTKLKAKAQQDSSLSKQQDNQSINTKAYEKSSNSFSASPQSKGRGRARAATPSKLPRDRDKLFGKGSPAPSIPPSELKATTIVAEIKKLNVKETTLAATMLLRALIELSEKYYREKSKLQKIGGLAERIGAAANSMFNKGLISQSELRIILAYTKTPESMFHISTLQAYLHAETHHPDSQSLNTFWDEIGCFVRTCW